MFEEEERLLVEIEDGIGAEKILNTMIFQSANTMMMVSSKGKILNAND
jgi:hypothetical protein